MAFRFASRRLGAAAVAGGFLLAAAACGSRTGLFVPDGFENGVDGSANADGGFDASVGCQPGNFDFQLALTQLMFVLDRSGSMAFTLDGRPNQPRNQWRWTILQSALSQTITTFDNQIAMGAKFFPEEITSSQVNQSDLACRLEATVNIPPAQGNANAILRFFDTATPLGGTPTSEAIRVSALALQNGRAVARTIVLATDGAPNCNADLPRQTCTCTGAIGQPPCSQSINGQYNCLDDTRTIATIQNVAQNDKIPVYVIGIGSLERPEFLSVLDDMAVAGGRPRATGPTKYYSANSEADLTSALGEIRDRVAKCTYLTPSAPQNPDNISVTVDDIVIPRDTTQQNGWDWIDQNLGELAFFGSACTAAQNASTPQAVGGTVTCDP